MKELKIFIWCLLLFSSVKNLAAGTTQQGDTHCTVGDYAVGRWKPIHEDSGPWTIPGESNLAVVGYRYPCTPSVYEGGSGYSRSIQNLTCTEYKIVKSKNTLHQLIGLSLHV